MEDVDGITGIMDVGIITVGTTMAAGITTGGGITTAAGIMAGAAEMTAIETATGTGTETATGIATEAATATATASGKEGEAEKGNTVFDIDSEEEKPLPVKDPSRDVGVAAMCEA